MFDGLVLTINESMYIVIGIEAIGAIIGISSTKISLPDKRLCQRFTFSPMPFGQQCLFIAVTYFGQWPQWVTRSLPAV